MAGPFAHHMLVFLTTPTWQQVGEPRSRWLQDITFQKWSQIMQIPCTLVTPTDAATVVQFVHDLRSWLVVMGSSIFEDRTENMVLKLLLHVEHQYPSVFTGLSSTDVESMALPQNIRILFQIEKTLNHDIT